MANEEHVARLRRGVEAWNAWRDARTPDSFQPDLSHAQLDGADLTGAKLYWTNLYKASLRGATLNNADLFRAELTAVDATGAKCREANFEGAFFTSPNAEIALQSGADLSGADLTGARLPKADLTGVKLHNAHLVDAKLPGSFLEQTDLRGATLTGANLSGVSFIGTHLQGATLSDCEVYGCAVWNVQLDGAVQSNLRISRRDEPTITVDNLEVAQFLYLMLHNSKIRDVIDTLTSKVVLILGRFTPERKAVLDALREELPRRNYVPVLFDFDRPSNPDILHTITLLARMARFVIADITDPAMVRTELTQLVPALPSVAFQILLQEDGKPFVEWETVKLYRNVLDIHRYTDLSELLADLPKAVIAPVEAKVSELRALRASDS